MEGLVPLLLTAGLSGGFLYAAKKKEGFASLVEPPVDKATGSATTFITESGAQKFNPMMNLMDPQNNPLFPPNASQTVIMAKDQEVKQALGSIVASPTSGLLTLKPSDTSIYDITQSKGGQTMEQIRMCEKLRASSCDAFNDPKFAEVCGVCHEGGRDSGGNATLGGLFVTQDDKLNARESAGRMKASRVTYTPSVGQCTPGRFTVNKAQCERMKKQLECEKKQNFDVPGCSQCFQDERFYFVDDDVELVHPTLVLTGEGQMTISFADAAGKPTTLKKSLSATSTKIAVPVFKEGDILEVQIHAENGGTAKVAGFLEGRTASGSFTMDIVRLIQTDLESGAKPRVTGFQTLDGNDVSTIRPAAGKTAMRLPVRNVFSFVSPEQVESTYCSAAPFLKSYNSAEFLNSGPCYKKGQAPGKYSLECLQDMFVNAGCTIQGEGYPSNAEKANTLMRGPRGELLTVAQIAGKVYEANQTAFSGQQGGKKLAIPEWDQVSRFCTGKHLNNPCDTDNKATGPLSADCLSYLWQNAGATDTRPGALGPTYTNSSKTTSLNGKTVRFCTAAGTMAPINAQGQYNQAAIAEAHKAGGVEGVKALYNRIHAAANDNTLPDQARKIQIEQCYGMLLEPLPDATIPSSSGSSSSIPTQSVLDYAPGRTKSALQRFNYIPMDWSRFSKPVAVLGNYGMAPWGTWWAPKFPSNAGAKWIWTFAGAVNDEPSWDWRQFYYRYINTTKNAIQANLIITADNKAMIYLNDAFIGPASGDVNRFQVSFPPGESKLQINVANMGGPAGLCVVAQDATRVLFVSDERWTTNA